jgi:hypothetical protein
MTNKYRKRCSTSFAVREKQMKTILRFDFTLVTVVIIKKTKPNIDEDVG